MKRLHIDTDLGGDIDDLCALAMVLHWPGAELVGVTTVAEHQGKRAGYAGYVLQLAGRPDIAVAAGAEASLDCYRSWQALPDEAVYWPGSIAAAPTPLDECLDLVQRSIEQGATIVAIGALTNLALLEKRSPGILRHARLYVMGGYVFPPREGYPAWGPDSDFNLQIDPQAAHDVLARSNPTLVPLAVTLETSLRRAYLATLNQAGPVARLIARQAAVFARDEQYEVRYGRACSGLPDDTINFLHDPLACAVALAWDGAEVQEVSLKSEITDGWLRHTIDESGKPTKVVTGVNGEEFSDLWLRMVARMDQPRTEPEMTQAALVELLRLFESAALPVWLDGGWGVDALLESQTRTHKDVDLVLSVVHVPALQRLLGTRGFRVREGKPPHSFVMADGAALEVDVHAVTFDDNGNGVYRMQNDEDWVYPAEGFRGKGLVGGRVVRCLSPTTQVLGHAYGYVPVEKDFADMERLAERFGMVLPPQLRRRASERTQS